jgi:hypothetical protein
MNKTRDILNCSETHILIECHAEAMINISNEQHEQIAFSSFWSVFILLLETHHRH